MTWTTTYICDKKEKNGSCRGLRVKREELDLPVWEFFQKYKLDLDQTIEHLTEQQSGIVAAAGAALETAEAELATVRRNRGELESSFTASLSNPDAADFARFSRMDAKLEEQEAAAEASAEQSRTGVTAAKLVADEILDPESEAFRQLAKLKDAAAGKIQDAEGLKAVRAALQTLFKHFEIYESDGEQVIQPIDRDWVIAYDLTNPDRPKFDYDIPPSRIPLAIAVRSDPAG